MKSYYVVAAFALLISVAACDRDPVVATVGDKEITEAEFTAFLEFKRLPADDSSRRQAVLEQYVEREALAEAVTGTDLLNEKMIEVELNEFRKEMLISRYFEKFLSQEVTDEAVRNYYNMHADEFEQKKVHVAHILFRTDKKMSETERKAKLTTAQEAYSKVTSEAEFADIATEYSEDKVSARKGGDLGWLKEGAIDPRFSETIFSLEKGEISEPFETVFGFHVVKVLEGPQVVKRPFDAVKGNIRYQLRNQAKEAELERLLSEVEVDFDELVPAEK